MDNEADDDKMTIQEIYYEVSNIAGDIGICFSACREDVEVYKQQLRDTQRQIAQLLEEIEKTLPEEDHAIYICGL